jgi:hypothetical protein
MNLEEARKVVWLKNNPRPMGELLDEGFLNASKLEWAAEKAFDPAIQQAAQVLLAALKKPSLPAKTEKKAQPSVTPLEIEMTLEKARATLWPLAPYKGQPMGELLESKQLSLKDLGYAIENAWDEKVRQAATALALVRLEQVVKEPAPSAGFVHVVSAGRSFSQRRQYQLTLLQGVILGGVMGVALVATIIQIINMFKPHPESKPLSEIVSTPMGIVGLVVAVILLAFLGWLSNFIPNQITKRIEKKIDEHRRGEEGEEKTVQLIVQALDGNWRLFRNVLLPGRNQGDLDLVLVGPPGVWVLEVKNFSGEYRTGGATWQYRHGKTWKAASVNPSQQASTNAARLASFFKASNLKVFVTPAIVWANESSPLFVKDPAVAVWPFKRLPDELGNIWQGEKLSKPEREKIIEMLTKLCLNQKAA